MKSKNGFIFGLLGPFYLIAIIVILGLLIWFGFRVSATIGAVISFVSTWWWLIVSLIILILYQAQVKAILNAIFGRLGVKI